MAAYETKMQETLKGVAKLYSRSLDEHGVAPLSVGWKDEATQRLRFEKLVEVIDIRATSGRIAVNDLGCGYGAMFNYLDGLPYVRLIRYYGYDISEEMLTVAKQFVDKSRAEFIQSPRVTLKADYSFVSGTFNVNLEANDELWTEYVKESLLNLATMSVKGFAFNLLRTNVEWKQDSLYYGDPLIFFDFCKNNISPYVSVLSDYGLFEWTIVVRKNDLVG